MTRLRKDLSTMSSEPDPYSLEHYPTAFQVDVRGQKHNARQLAHHIAVSGRHQNMYRRPLERQHVDDILRATGYVKGVDGRLQKRKTAGRARRAAARELRRRAGLPTVGPLGVPDAPKRPARQLRFRLQSPSPPQSPSQSPQSPPQSTSPSADLARMRLQF